MLVCICREPGWLTQIAATAAAERSAARAQDDGPPCSCGRLIVGKEQCSLCAKGLGATCEVAEIPELAVNVAGVKVNVGGGNGVSVDVGDAVAVDVGAEGVQVDAGERAAVDVTATKAGVEVDTRMFRVLCT